MGERSAFVFPGAGVEVSEDEGALLARHEAVIRPLLERASRTIGAELVCGASPDGQRALGPLAQQAFSFAFGLGLAAVHQAQGAAPVAIAGHSLGVYAAVVAAGGLCFEDGLAALVLAYQCASSAAAAGAWGLAAVTGPGAAELDGWSRGSPSLRRVITNNPVSHVIAGEREAIQALLAIAERAGARTRWLDRVVPYHHPQLLAPAAGLFRAGLERLAFSDPEVPVISTLAGQAGRVLAKAQALRAFVADNLVSPIEWDGVVRALVDQGIEVVFECGPGLTLSRAGRLVEADLRHVTARTVARGAA